MTTVTVPKFKRSEEVDTDDFLGRRGNKYIIEQFNEGTLLYEPVVVCHSKEMQDYVWGFLHRPINSGMITRESYKITRRYGLGDKVVQELRA